MEPACVIPLNTDMSAACQASRRLAQRVVRLTITDLLIGRKGDQLSAQEFVETESFSSTCEKAGYPNVLVDTLKKSVLLSLTEKRYVCREIIRVLNRYEIPRQKKPPHEAGV